MQETFNIIVRHLRAQGCKSQEWKEGLCTGICYYRSGNLKCAAGILISDEDYRPEMEYRTIKEVMMRFGLNIPDIELVNRMQLIHDHVDVPLWEASFVDLAKEFGLVVPD